MTDALQSSKMASGTADYTQDWLNADAFSRLTLGEDCGHIASDEESDHSEHDQGPATRLYLLSLEGLQRLCRRGQSTLWLYHLPFTIYHLPFTIGRDTCTPPF